MQIVRNESLVARRKRIGQVTSMVGLAVLIGGMAFTWLAPKWDIPPEVTLYVPFLALLGGFILSSIGIYYTNHWGRSPRPDEVLDTSLKGMERRYKLYHFALPAPHVLLTPQGLVVLVLKTEPGEFTIDGDKWRQRLSATRILGFMGREGIGKPAKEAAYLVDQMQSFLEKQAPEIQGVPVDAVVVFVADRVTLNVVKESSVPPVRAAKLKGFLRSRSGNQLSHTVLEQLERVLDGPA